MELKKSPKADLGNKKLLFLEIGLIISLGITYFAFNYSTDDIKKNTLQENQVAEEVEEIIITEPQEEIAPPPAAPEISFSDVIEIKDEDYALWYRDATEEPQKYHGKTVRFKGQVAMLRRDKNNMFAPGRFVMTCCVDDIQFLGIPCKYAASKSLEPRAWVMVKATISAEKHPLYHGELGPVLTAISVEKAEPADPDVATF